MNWTQPRSGEWVLWKNGQAVAAVWMNNITQECGWYANDEAGWSKTLDAAKAAAERAVRGD